MVDNFKKFENEIKDLRETLARSQADYQNLLRRNEREKFEMTFFINSSVVLKILPFVDNIERLIGSTPEEQRNTALFE
jgi:molecular chaperone GrpE